MSEPDLIERIIHRAGGRCESCLSRAARNVYWVVESGAERPPAWNARATCPECHLRLLILDGRRPSAPDREVER